MVSGSSCSSGGHGRGLLWCALFKVSAVSETLHSGIAPSASNVAELTVNSKLPTQQQAQRVQKSHSCILLQADVGREGRIRGGARVSKEDK